MPLSLRPMTKRDIPPIASLHYHSTIQNPWTRLLNRTADPEAIQERLRQYLTCMLNEATSTTTNHPSSSPKKEKRFFTIIDTDLTDEPISWCWWSLPDNHNQDDNNDAKEEDNNNEQLVIVVAVGPDQNTLHGDPIPGLNYPLREAFIKGVDAMRARVLKGRPCYLLENLATSPSHSGRGAATMLVTWPFEQAKQEGVFLYLDTGTDYAARRLYERLGFVKVDECHLNLEDYGGTGTHTHIGMIRDPSVHS